MAQQQSIEQDPPAQPSQTALTARSSQEPGSHDGQSSFTFRLDFSEDFGISHKTLRDYVFTVTGGVPRQLR